MIAQVQRTSRTACQPVEPMRQLLHEIESLLVLLPPGFYAASHEPEAPPLGWYLESCLAAVEALISADPPFPIVFRASPQTRSTMGCARAIEKTRDLAVALEGWPRLPLDTVVCVQQIAFPLDDGERSWSTLRAEIQSVSGLVIHRQRTIARLLERFGIHAPKGFGCMRVPPLRARTSAPPAWSVANSKQRSDRWESGLS
jgi:hypothetical protein